MKVDKVLRAEGIEMVRRLCGGVRYEKSKVHDAGKAGEWTSRRIEKLKTVYSVIRYVSRSGTLRRIDFYTFYRGDMVFLTGYFSNILGIARHKDDGLIVRGWGMDMAWDVVYEVNRAVYGDGKRLEHRHL